MQHWTSVSRKQKQVLHTDCAGTALLKKVVPVPTFSSAPLLWQLYFECEHSSSVRSNELILYKGFQWVCALEVSAYILLDISIPVESTPGRHENAKTVTVLKLVSKLLDGSTCHLRHRSFWNVFSMHIHWNDISSPVTDLLSELFFMAVRQNARYRRPPTCLIPSALLNYISFSLQCSGECKVVHLKKIFLHRNGSQIILCSSTYVYYDGVFKKYGIAAGFAILY